VRPDQSKELPQDSPEKEEAKVAQMGRFGFFFVVQ